MGVDQTGTVIAKPSGTEITRFSQTMRDADSRPEVNFSTSTTAAKPIAADQRQHGAGADRHRVRAQHHDDADEPESRAAKAGWAAPARRGTGSRPAWRRAAW